VAFHYGKGSGVIEHLDLHVHAGQKIGVVGRSGAGKSTLANLLLRFHDVEAGRITVDSIDIATVQQDSLRAQVGVVTQDTSLLHRSVRENILYGRPDASEAELVEAARQANADGFIQELVDAKGRRGYDAQVGERGVNEAQVEAGPALCGALLCAGLVDELLLYQAPVLLGDGARPLFAGLGIDSMGQRLRFDLVDEARFGDDRRLLLRPVSP
jgi:riboflavin biosynthesis pyrimidine reductase